MIIGDFNSHIPRWNYNRSNKPDCHEGFRRKSTTTEQATYLSRGIKDGFYERNFTLAIYVDFKNAYDKVWRKKYIEKLVNFGFGGNMLNYKLHPFPKDGPCKLSTTFSKFVQLQDGLPRGFVTGA
ncbi:hypothetical protein CEXT_299171 [Caerostris extrusa]|uniref:Reverse transcriptase n=1 Tax=Caerostris extrusa TaxID=172846 RepID=A0AAV4S6V4_CAEEX|nr:hypothetical protein CEXT_299171 [Caerostris extrusa]